MAAMMRPQKVDGYRTRALLTRMNLVLIGVMVAGSRVRAFQRDRSGRGLNWSSPDWAGRGPSTCLHHDDDYSHDDDDYYSGEPPASSSRRAVGVLTRTGSAGPTRPSWQFRSKPLSIATTRRMGSTCAVTTTWPVTPVDPSPLGTRFQFPWRRLYEPSTTTTKKNAVSVWVKDLPSRPILSSWTTKQRSNSNLTTHVSRKTAPTPYNYYYYPRQLRWMAYLPLCLCLLPFLTPIRTTPSFWKMVPLQEQLVLAQQASSSWTALSFFSSSAVASVLSALVVAGFLLSNLSYVGAGLFLLLKTWQRYPTTTATLSLWLQTTWKATTRPPGPRSSSASWPLPAFFGLQSLMSMLPPQFMDHVGLAAWTLLSGLVSTIFHALQATGPDIHLAEAWCFVDHGIALTSILYFIHVLGWPQQVGTWIVSLVGLVALAGPSVGCLGAAPSPHLYAATHALWHILSSLTAVLWATEAAASSSSSSRSTTTTTSTP